ncbi:uncharacterized protein LODBEIA_P24280 [Lodderomyces beijingensis]|uniref:Phosphatidylinositol 4-kinase n=1 Tax=Lodderomyces beijingensis TaxID=1775926 RepID=A0ABP0ZJ82_9ASCO
MPQAQPTNDRDPQTPRQQGTSAPSLLDELSPVSPPGDGGGTSPRMPLAFRSRSTPNTPHRLPFDAEAGKHGPLRRKSFNEGMLQEHGRRSSSSSSNNNNKFEKFTKTVIIPAAKWAYSPITKLQRNQSKKKINDKPDEYRIEYSIFGTGATRDAPLSSLEVIAAHMQLQKNINKTRNSAKLHSSAKYEPESSSPSPSSPEALLTQVEFEILYEQVRHVIEVDHVYPERIPTGSSGSYFVFNKVEASESLYAKVGVFKPKSEEPYGPLSPKWTKWLHRTFFPCFFGRSCLIPNLGYISEAAACVLDQQLQSFIVPYTEVVQLRSPTFYYPFWDKSRHVEKLPYKIGSFQVFLQGYVNADLWFKMYPVPSGGSVLPNSSTIEVSESIEANYRFEWSRESMLQFQEEIEKMVILDYIMRNTDRGHDNWMVKIDWIEVGRNKTKRTKTIRPVMKIGAIDSGLAFPWKHPNEWRSFPFGWLFLPLSLIGRPFSKNTRQHYLPLLTSKVWWEATVVKLKETFMKDQDFKERMWQKQLAVLKGQAFNVVECLKLDFAGPLELTRRENMLVHDDLMFMPCGGGGGGERGAQEEEEEECGPRVFSSLLEPSYPSAEQDEHERFTSKAGSDCESELHDQLAPLLTVPSAPTVRGHQHHHSSYGALSEEPSTAGTNALDSGLSGFERIDKVLTTPPGRGSRVVIERLVREDSKPPVFTWC